jgi:nucleoid-associated protein YgaU
VRKNDRYASIARDVLGDGNRWDEIYAMNKDKFPDPHRIREGVRIKVPVRK